MPAKKYVHLPEFAELCRQFLILEHNVEQIKSEMFSLHINGNMGKYHQFFEVVRGQETIINGLLLKISDAIDS